MPTGCVSTCACSCTRHVAPRAVCATSCRHGTPILHQAVVTSFPPSALPPACAGLHAGVGPPAAAVSLAGGIAAPRTRASAALAGPGDAGRLSTWGVFALGAPASAASGSGGGGGCGGADYPSIDLGAVDAPVFRPATRTPPSQSAPAGIAAACVGAGTALGAEVKGATGATEPAAAAVPSAAAAAAAVACTTPNLVATQPCEPQLGLQALGEAHAGAPQPRPARLSEAAAPGAAAWQPSGPGGGGTGLDEGRVGIEVAAGMGSAGEAARVGPGPDALSARSQEGVAGAPAELESGGGSQAGARAAREGGAGCRSGSGSSAASSAASSRPPSPPGNQQQGGGGRKGKKNKRGKRRKGKR